MRLSIIYGLAGFLGLAVTQQCGAQHGGCPSNKCCSQYGCMILGYILLSQHANHLKGVVEATITAATAVNRDLENATTMTVKDHMDILHLENITTMAPTTTT
jgi:hypothetical protein